jgi:hypothetical protein
MRSAYEPRGHSAEPYVAPRNRIDPTPQRSPPVNRLCQSTHCDFAPDIRSHAAQRRASPDRPTMGCASGEAGHMLRQRTLRAARTTARNRLSLRETGLIRPLSVRRRPTGCAKALTTVSLRTYGPALRKARFLIARASWDTRRATGRATIGPWVAIAQTSWPIAVSKELDPSADRIGTRRECVHEKQDPGHSLG